MRRARLRSIDEAPSGFTLLEVLIVVGIISALIAMILPTLVRVREQARIVTCCSQERQLYLASVAFAADHDGCLPRPGPIGSSPTDPQVLRMCIWPLDDVGIANFRFGDFWMYLSPSLDVRQSVALCPSDTGEQYRYGADYGARRNFSYSLNAQMVRDYTDGTGTHMAGLLLRRVKQPGSVIMIFEELAPNDTYCVDPQVPHQWADQPSARHGISLAIREGVAPSDENIYRTRGRGNHCFFDGHVECLSPQQIFDHPGYYTDLLK